MSDALPLSIGVVGAGTMGAGIAQLAAAAGIETHLYDPAPEALTRGLDVISDGLQRLVDRGRLDAECALAIRSLVHPAGELAELADVKMVVEAAPERLELKKELLATLAATVKPDCVLATNTSSLSVTEIAASVPRPGRVVGLHFFNPAPVMRLIELVAGESSDQVALDRAAAVGRAMGKHVIEVADIPGFVVNRCNRPYSLEALRLLESGVGDVEQVDRIARLEGRFRMGPFELMDLIGLDTNHAVAEALHRQSYGESRYQPSLLQSRKVAAGQLGRKAGRGWYGYGQGAPTPTPDPEPGAPTADGGGGKAVAVIGELRVAVQLRDRLRACGFTVLDEPDDAAWLMLACDGKPHQTRSPQAILLAGTSLHASDPQAAGFHFVPPLADALLIELTSTTRTAPEAVGRLTELIAAIGCHPEHVGDAPGLILGRIVCQLINEAAFLIGSGAATADDIDAGLQLGVNHPRGPVTWAREIGLEHVVAVLDGLHRELGEDRYRVAPLLRQRLAAGSDELAAER